MNENIKSYNFQGTPEHFKSINLGINENNKNIIIQ